MGATLAGCGEGDENVQQEAPPDLPPEQAFLNAMVPHHESAVEVAEVASDQAEHPEIKHLAANIIESQTSEIEEMREIHQALYGEELVPDEGAHEALGLSPEEAGMHELGAASSLAAEDPFDRAFIDHMVPHHQGAIRMARAVIEESDNADVRDLAERIVAAQRREVSEMLEWREDWYGAGSVDEGAAPEAAGHVGH